MGPPFDSIEGKCKRQKSFRQFGAPVLKLHRELSRAPALLGPFRLLGKRGARLKSPGKDHSSKEFIEGRAGFKVSLRSLRGQSSQLS
jgi:hypothetical protein